MKKGEKLRKKEEGERREKFEGEKKIRREGEIREKKRESGKKGIKGNPTVNFSLSSYFIRVPFFDTPIVTFLSISLLFSPPSPLFLPPLSLSSLSLHSWMRMLIYHDSQTHLHSFLHHHIIFFEVHSL